MQMVPTGIMHNIGAVLAIYSRVLRYRVILVCNEYQSMQRGKDFTVG